MKLSQRLLIHITSDLQVHRMVVDYKGTRDLISLIDDKATTYAF